MNTRPLRYVLVTPARNEEALIEDTIQSVASQTIPPTRWVIVSDASTDRTDEIVQSYVEQYPWISLVRMSEQRVRDFGAKVDCFRAGLETIQSESFDVLGNLDADITFEPDYIAYLLAKFEANLTLGVAGTPFVDEGTTYDFRFSSVDHVSGACQLFRRDCYEDIGGYIPIRGGGIDTVAVRTARMKNWDTRTFLDKVCYHHRPMGTATVGAISASFRLGKQDYSLGGHPVWQVCRSCYQTLRKPYVVGGVSLLVGYCWARIRTPKRPVSSGLVAFTRKEQIARLKRFIGLRPRPVSQSS